MGFTTSLRECTQGTLMVTPVLFARHWQVLPVTPNLVTEGLPNVVGYFRACSTSRRHLRAHPLLIVAVRESEPLSVFNFASQLRYYYHG